MDDSSPKWKISFLLKVFQIDHTNDANLAITLDHLSNFFKRIGASHVELTSLLRDKHTYCLKSNGLISKDFYTVGPKKLHDDEPCLDLWQGFIDIRESIESFGQTINHLSGPVGSVSQVIQTDKLTVGGMKIGFLWKFVEENDERFEKLSNFTSVCDKPSQALKFNGFSFGNFINGTKFVEQFNSSFDTSITSPELHLRHTEDLMELIFRVSGTAYGQKFKLNFDYKSVKAVTISRSETGINVFFHLSNPPKIYIATDDMDPDIIDMEKSKFWSFNYKTYRLNKFPKQTLFKESWTRWHDCKCITSTCIGKCSVFSINISNESSNNHSNLTELIRNFYVWRRYSQLSIFFGFVEVIKGNHRPVDMINDLPFGVNYALQSIQSISYAFKDDLIINNQFDEVLEFIKLEISKQNTDWLITTMYKLCDDYLYGKVYHALSRLKSIFVRIEKDWPAIYNIKSSSNPYIKHLRRVLLTPTRVLILPELAFQSSQFLEIADKDCVLRLTIRDEDMSNLGYAVTRNEEDCVRHENRRTSSRPEANLPSPEEYFLRKCFADRLLPSLEVAGKSYQIYGASSSQLRDHGMVLYSRDGDNRDAAEIRNAIGTIRSTEISKYIARVGLSLSQVLAFVDLPDGIEVRYTKDILGGEHPESFNMYNFTDGCGLMSLELAEYIWSDLKRQGVVKLNQDDKDTMPTAFQIRFLGCKGMIVLDLTLSGKVIVLRESMRKVDSRLGTIGIVKISEPRRAYLNKPLVTILNQIGLTNDFFVTLLSNAISDLVDSFRSNIKASKALFMFSDLHRFINHIKLAELNYDLLGDPFFRSSLELVFHQGLDVIKQKARIPLDLSTSRTLFGVADPTATHHLPYVVVHTDNGDDSDSQSIKIFDQNRQVIHSSICSRKSLFFDQSTENALSNASPQSLKPHKGVLEYGQVFVFPSDFKKPITCDVIVTKFPCMHPGDVRRLKAVDKPELHGIRDCIVFPVDGHRPHSNEMAGSDLDGDEYCVIWSPKFKGIRIENPMDFPDVTCDKSSLFSNNEIVNFYMRYLQDCAVGRIASAHLVWADMLPRGIFDERCIELARKYSISLDFAKTGETKTLSKDERNREPPDFAQNWRRKPSYHSARALGSIYRTISMFELFLSEETSKEKIIEPGTDPRLKHPNWNRYSEQAVQQLEIYSSIVSYLLEISEFADEVELFTQINEKSVLFGPNDSKTHRPPNHQDSMIYCVNNLLVKPMEENFYREFDSLQWKNKSEDEFKKAYMAKASAYYMVTMKKSKTSKKPLWGLPWIGKYSVHLFELLQKSEVIQHTDNRLACQLNRRTAVGGFSGTTSERNAAADSCWQFLSNWLAQYLNLVKAERHDANRIINDMRKLFEDIVFHYTTGDRKTRTPSSILDQIFKQIKSKQKSLNFKRNLFDACNDPIGLMTVLILERTYYEGTCTKKIPDGSFNSNSTSTYRVLLGNSGEAEITSFISMLSAISGCVSIVYTPAFQNYNCYKLSVFGSRASILIVQSIIGIHNRLASSHPHYVKNPNVDHH